MRFFVFFFLSPSHQKVSFDQRFVVETRECLEWRDQQFRKNEKQNTGDVFFPKTLSQEEKANEHDRSRGCCSGCDEQAFYFRNLGREDPDDGRFRDALWSRFDSRIMRVLQWESGCCDRGCFGGQGEEAPREW